MSEKPVAYVSMSDVQDVITMKDAANTLRAVKKEIPPSLKVTEDLFLQRVGNDIARFVMENPTVRTFTVELS